MRSIATTLLCLILLAAPAHAEPAEEAAASAPPPETAAHREARRARAQRAAGGYPEVWAVSTHVVAEADEAAGSLGLPPPEVTCWYRPPGRCSRCSNAHARGGVTLALPDAAQVCADGAADCSELEQVRQAMARELSRRLGRHFRVSLVELGPDPRHELHTSFRNGERIGQPYRLPRRQAHDGIVVRPDELLPPPAAVVFGGSTDASAPSSAASSAD